MIITEKLWIMSMCITATIQGDISENFLPRNNCNTWYIVWDIIAVSLVNKWAWSSKNFLYTYVLLRPLLTASSVKKS